MTLLPAEVKGNSCWRPSFLTQISMEQFLYWGFPRILHALGNGLIEQLEPFQLLDNTTFCRFASNQATAKSHENMRLGSLSLIYLRPDALCFLFPLLDFPPFSHLVNPEIY
jgi:hypothetical protein